MAETVNIPLLRALSDAGTGQRNCRAATEAALKQVGVDRGG